MKTGYAVIQLLCSGRSELIVEIEHQNKASRSFSWSEIQTLRSGADVGVALGTTHTESDLQSPPVTVAELVIQFMA